MKFNITSNIKQQLLNKKIKSLNHQKQIFFNLKYLIYISKYYNNINYKNIDILKYFLTPYGEISSRLNNLLTLKQQHKITKLIKYARNLKLFPNYYKIII